MCLLKQESKIRKMQMAVVHAHRGGMGPCQFSRGESPRPRLPGGKEAVGLGADRKREKDSIVQSYR